MTQKFDSDILIGIDEAGRGPLLGPVSVGAVMINRGLLKKIKKQGRLKGLNDSKKLSEKMREKLFEKISDLEKEGILKFAVTLVSEKVIDKKGISFAIRSGLEKNLKKLTAGLSREDFNNLQILLDGGLRAPAEFKNQKTIIRGDSKEPVISAASIMAKVTRDRFVVKLSKKYPQYKIHEHKGYGTKQHTDLIKKFGLSEIHRQSFCRNFV